MQSQSKRLNVIRLILITVCLLYSCNPENPGPQNNGGGVAEGKGAFIVCEGNYDWGQGTLAFYNQKADSVALEVFQTKNGRTLGNVFQSMILHEGNAYLVINNSQKIEIADAKTLESKGAITGLLSPRYLLPLSGSQAYCSDIYADKIHILDLAEKKITGHIPLVGWTEQMARVGQFVYATNRRADFDDRVGGDYLYKIDPVQHKIIDSLRVGAGADQMIVDANQNIWVNTAATPVAGQAGLVCVSPANFSIVSEIPLSSGLKPRALAVYGDRLYFLAGDLFWLDVKQPSSQPALLVERGDRLFYGLGVCPTDGVVFVAEAKDYVSQGTLYRYSPTGKLLGQYKTGIIPNGFVFN